MKASQRLCKFCISPYSKSLHRTIKRAFFGKENIMGEIIKEETATRTEEEIVLLTPMDAFKIIG